MRARQIGWRSVTAGGALIALGLLLGSTTALAEPAEDFRKGEVALAGGDIVQAMDLLKKSADAGHAPAQALLAELLDKAEEDAEALKYFRMAAEQGNAAGQYGLAVHYSSGEGIAADPKQALMWLERSAEQNYPPALRALGAAYRGGRLGLAIDLERARQLDEAATRYDKELAEARRAARRKDGG